MVGGPGTWICADCVALATDMLRPDEPPACTVIQSDVMQAETATAAELVVQGPAIGSSFGHCTIRR